MPVKPPRSHCLALISTQPLELPPGARAARGCRGESPTALCPGHQDTPGQGHAALTVPRASAAPGLLPETAERCPARLAWPGSATLSARHVSARRVPAGLPRSPAWHHCSPAGSVLSSSKALSVGQPVQHPLQGIMQ